VRSSGGSRAGLAASGTPAIRSTRCPAPGGWEDRIAGFLFRLETVDGAAADPPTLESAVPNWDVGHEIPLGQRTLRVIGKRDDDGDQPPVLVVEDTAA
jgi:hypothetical protein